MYPFKPRKGPPRGDKDRLLTGWGGEESKIYKRKGLLGLYLLCFSQVITPTLLQEVGD